MDFGKYYSFSKPEIIQHDFISDSDYGLFTAVNNIAVLTVERIEDAVIDEIIKAIKDTEVTDLIVLDKGNIKNALLKASPKKTINYGMCPTCCVYLHSSHRYCPMCGQKIEKGERDDQ